MGNSVISVENLSKQYRLGEIGTGSMVNDLNRWWHTVRGKEDPYLKIGETNDRTTAGDSQYVWSLKDINFEISQGDAVGIIGRNGAGKSTLLKILSRVTQPTTGGVKVKGRIASLLEVGTGFHPDLSGRENIFLNGAILGMRKEEIKRKFDEIVDFAGVERYIDTPVKRYSSGMYVRLAFAVAAHLESEILIVDEVLAVGDAEFQKKCLGKMSDVSKGEGRTVLFVSHSMASIKALCNRAILLDKGTIKHDGDIARAIDLYLDNDNTPDLTEIEFPREDLEVYVSKIYLNNEKGALLNSFSNEDKIFVHVEVEVQQFIEQVEFSVCLTNSNHVNVIFSSLSDSTNKVPVSLNPGKYNLKMEVKDNLLVPGAYSLSLYTHFRNIKSIKAYEQVLKFHISEVGSLLAPYGKDASNVACVIGGGSWSIQPV
ncbi:ABC transporter ATP-binding protein [Mucilaginibacter sp. AW1-3]